MYEEQIACFNYYFFYSCLSEERKGFAADIVVIFSIQDFYWKYILQMYNS